MRIHRYAGLGTALFLAVAGLTGSVLAFTFEIDSWLNPHLFHAEGRGERMSFDTLVKRIEQFDPRLQVDYITFDGVVGHAAFTFVSPRANLLPDQKKEITYDQVFIDPVTGDVLGARSRVACCFAPEKLVPFLLQVHHSLFLPGRWGWWFMGGIAIIWLFDCFIGFYLTLPRAGPLISKWKPAWLIKKGAGNFRLHLDLHRAGGLWLWAVLFALALSSVYLNLKEELFKPLVSVFSPLTQRPSSAVSRPLPPPSAAVVSFENVRMLANEEARQRNWDLVTSGVTYLRGRGVYLAFLWPSHFNRGTGMGTPVLVYDAHTGKLLSAEIPGAGTAGDTFNQIQFPLHSGQIAGLSGRIVMVVAGIVVTMLSITGIVVWWRKRQSRLIAAKRTTAAANRNCV